MKPKPRIYWIRPTAKTDGPPKLIQLPEEKTAPAGWQPVCLLPLPAPGSLINIEGHLAEFAAHGIRVQLRMIAGRIARPKSKKR